MELSVLRFEISFSVPRHASRLCIALESIYTYSISPAVGFFFTTTITTTHNTQTLYEQKKKLHNFFRAIFFLSFLFFPELPFVLDWIGVKHSFLFFFCRAIFSSCLGRNVWVFILLSTLFPTAHTPQERSPSSRQTQSNDASNKSSCWRFSFFFGREGTLLLLEKINAWEIRNLLYGSNLDKLLGDLTKVFRFNYSKLHRSYM